MIDEPPFWIIWNPHSPTSPQRKYPSRKAAQHEARNMARKIGMGEIFYVMKAQSCHQQQIEMCDWVMSEWGIGAPCPYHHVKPRWR